MTGAFAPGQDERIQYVRVTNNLPFNFVDRYDGVPVTIPPGKSENLPPDMAYHFFGYAPGVNRKTMLRHTAKRHGWNTPEFALANPDTGKTKADDWFDKLDITAITYKLVPADEPDPSQPIPADPEGSIREEVVEVKAETEQPKPRPAPPPRRPPGRPRMVAKREETPVNPES